MKKHIIVAHGQSTHHVEGIVGGWYNRSELTANGIDSSKRIGAYIKNMKLSGTVSFYSSDLIRTRQCADIISNIIDRPVTFTSALREMSFGENEGKTQSEHELSMIPSAKSDKLRLNHAICAGAETRGGFGKRIYEFISEASESDNTIIVTHGFSTTYLICAILRIPLEGTSFVSYNTPPGSVTILDEDDIYKNVTLSQLGMVI